MGICHILHIINSDITLMIMITGELMVYGDLLYFTHYKQ